MSGSLPAQPEETHVNPLARRCRTTAAQHRAGNEGRKAALVPFRRLSLPAGPRLRPSALWGSCRSLRILRTARIGLVWPIPGSLALRRTPHGPEHPWSRNSFKA